MSMDSSDTDFPPLPDGSRITSVSLNSERLSATLLTFGARLYSLSLDGGPSLVSHAPPDTFATTGRFAAAIVAPLANRIAGGRAPLDGKILELPVNEGRNHLHSGPTGTATANWQIAARTDAHVTFAIDLPNGLGGYPGNRRIEAAYTLDAAELTLTITATTDAPTFINPCFHPFWTMTGQGRDGHSLWLAATAYLPVDKEKIPTGEVRPTAGTDFDFSTARVPPTTIDNCFTLISDGTPRLAARLSGDNGISMELLTDAPGLQLFTGRTDGIALEPEIWPDAPNHAGFPSIRLDPGQTFRQVSIHRFFNA